MKIKKLFSLLFLIVLVFALFGCEKKDEKTYKVILPSGTPLIAFGALLDDENFNVEIVKFSPIKSL